MDLLLMKARLAKGMAAAWLLAALAGGHPCRAFEMTPSAVGFVDMDVFYSERLDLVNLSGQVMDLRDISLEVEPTGQKIKLPAYSWLPNYTVRLWLQKGPAHKPAPNEFSLLLAQDVFPNGSGMITLRHSLYGDLAEMLYGGKGIWEPRPKEETPPPEATALIPFKPGGAGGPPSLPPLPGQSAKPPEDSGGFEWLVDRVEPMDKNAGPDYTGNFQIFLRNGRSAIETAAAGNTPTLVKVLVKYPAGVKLPEALTKPGGNAFLCKQGPEGMFCPDVWWPQAPFNATVYAICQKVDLGAIGNDPLSILKGIPTGGAAVDCSAPKDLRWPAQ